MVMSKLCKQCRITKSFSIKPTTLDYRPVDTTIKNAILLEIHRNIDKLRGTDSFIILVDNSRYEIEIVKLITNDSDKIIFVTLKQHFMHYDSKRGRLVRVNMRYVEIEY